MLQVFYSPCWLFKEMMDETMIDVYCNVVVTREQHKS